MTFRYQRLHRTRYIDKFVVYNRIIQKIKEEVTHKPHQKTISKDADDGHRPKPTTLQRVVVNTNSIILMQTCVIIRDINIVQVCLTNNVRRIHTHNPQRKTVYLSIIRFHQQNHAKLYSFGTVSIISFILSRLDHTAFTSPFTFDTMACIP